MYKQTTTTKSNIKFIGIKIYETIDEEVDYIDHEFINDEEEQKVYASVTCFTKKILGIPYYQANGYFDPLNLLNPQGEIKA